ELSAKSGRVGNYTHFLRRVADATPAPQKCAGKTYSNSESRVNAKRVIKTSQPSPKCVPFREPHRQFMQRNKETGETQISGPAEELPAEHRLQRLQESNQLVLLCGAESTIVIDNSRGFSTVAQNRVIPGKRKQIMHQPAFRASAPERRRPHFVGCGLSS